MATAAIDLLQLHCPPTEVYYRPEVFGILDDLVEAGKLRFYGVSVEKVEEGLKGIEFPNVQSVQIIFNAFRHRPAERFLPLARERQVGVLARVPLASGLLSGKMTPASTLPRAIIAISIDMERRSMPAKPSAGSAVTWTMHLPQLRSLAS